MAEQTLIYPATFSPKQLFDMAKDNVSADLHALLLMILHAKYPEGITLRFAVTLNKPTIH